MSSFHPTVIRTKTVTSKKKFQQPKFPRNRVQSERIHFVTIEQKNKEKKHSKINFGHSIKHNKYSSASERKKWVWEQRVCLCVIQWQIEVLKLKLETRICRWATGTCSHNGRGILFQIEFNAWKWSFRCGPNRFEALFQQHRGPTPKPKWLALVINKSTLLLVSTTYYYSFELDIFIYRLWCWNRLNASWSHSGTAIQRWWRHDPDSHTAPKAKQNILSHTHRHHTESDTSS